MFGAALFGTSVFADNPNWSPEKKQQVEQNRNSNSGLGNGGEARNGRSLRSELSPRDVDPGNSGNQCQGGKNC
jgi:penicillin-binding protein 1A